MNCLHSFYEFNTVKEGKERLLQAIKLRDKIGLIGRGGCMDNFYWRLLDEDCKEIEKKIYLLENKLCKK